MEELLEVVSGQTGRKALREGNLEDAIIACGQCVGLIREIRTVKEVIEEIIHGAQAILEKLNVVKEK